MSGGSVVINKKIKTGDTLVIPDGWVVEFKNGRMTITNKHYTAESRKGFAFYEFINSAAK